MRSVHKALVAGAGALGMAMVISAAAWACTVQTRIVAVVPQEALPGTSVRVNGGGVAANSPVEIRWNNLQGQAVGVALADSEGVFRTDFTVPAAPAGVYSLVAVSGGSAVGRTSFAVAGDPSTASGPAPASAWHSGATRSAAAGSRSGPGLALGTGLLGVGLLALFAGFSLAVRQRRTLVRADGRA